MSTENAASTAVICGACSTGNADHAKFCKSCGHSLYEPCGSCNTPALLDQKFCANCGSDLDKTRIEKRATLNEYLVNAVSEAKSSEFDEALSLLTMVAQESDYRLADLAAAAKKAITQVTNLRDQALENSRQRIEKSMVALKEGRRDDVVKLLKPIPDVLLDDESRSRLASAEQFIAQLKVVEEDFTAASQQRDWLLAGGLIGQLHELLPENQSYQQIGGKIAAKLFAKAQKLVAKQRYESSADHLAAIPENCITPEVDQLRDQISDAIWFHDLVKAEPLVTPSLMRLAAKFSSVFPGDPQLQLSAKELATTFKQGQRSKRCCFPRWRGEENSWLGGKGELLTRISRLVNDDNASGWNDPPGTFNVAIGIGLAALGKGRIVDDMSGKKKKRFGRKKKTTGCWALDIGNRAFKAVRMELSEDKETVLLTDFFHQNFDSAIQKNLGQRRSHESLNEVIEQFKEQHSLEESVVWANLPSTETITRFVRLPPVPDKKANQLIESEIRERIPVDVEELLICQSMAAFDKENPVGRAVNVAVIRKTVVEERLASLEACELEIDGLLPDPLALVNTVTFEFKDELGITRAEEEAEKAKLAKKEKKAKKKKKKGEEKEGDDDSTSEETLADLSETGGETADDDLGANSSFGDKKPTVALIESGSSSTTLLLVSAETYWFWTVEMGGDDFDAAVARVLKIPSTEAEETKINPSSLESPAVQLSGVEQRLGELRSRLERISRDADQQDTNFEVVGTWTCGGGALVSQWLRRVVSQTAN